ncbi:MAG TPA: PEP-CTERM sorting domain-containing protein [Terriglobales bacterium]|nr:PEP-CTERM sorting domain-containing protein [Terriglobales bacterium]
MRRLLLLALVLGWAVCAFAGPVEFKFVGWNDGQWQNGYPYAIQPLGDSSGSILFVMCDDYFHGGEPGDIWDANITQLGSDNISLTRFNKVVAGPTALTPLMLYDEAGWILLQTLVEPRDQYQAMNYAVWYIFDPSQTPCNTACQFWLAQAQEAAAMHFPNTDFNRVYVITPVNQYDPNPDGVQEFLALGQDNGLLQGGPNDTVPEPGTLLLLGSGLLGILGRRFLH